MNQKIIERNMAFDVIQYIRQYYQLGKAMLFNLKFIGYFSLFLLQIAIVSTAVGFYFPTFQMIGFLLVVLSVALFSIQAMISLPIGMLMLATNKNLSLTIALRQKVFLIFLTVSFLLSLIFSSLSPKIMYVIPNVHSLFSELLVCAVYLGISLYLGSKNISLVMIALLIMVCGTKLWVQLFVPAGEIQLLVANIIVWSLVYRWWMLVKLKPGLTKSIFLYATPDKNYHLPLEVVFNFFGRRSDIKNPLNTMLLGCSDGTISMVRRMVHIYVFSFIFGWFLSRAIFPAIIIAIAYASLIFCVEFGIKMLMNTRRIWLLFDGDRRSIFNHMEKYFWRSLRTILIVDTFLIMLMLLISQRDTYIFYCFGLLCMKVFLSSVLYYSEIYFYKKGASKSIDINWRKIFFGALIFIPAIWYLMVKFYAPDIFEIKDVIAIAILVVVLSLFGFVRKACIKRWQHANI